MLPGASREATVPLPGPRRAGQGGRHGPGRGDQAPGWPAHHQREPAAAEFLQRTGRDPGSRGQLGVPGRGPGLGHQPLPGLGRELGRAAGVGDAVDDQRVHLGSQARGGASRGGGEQDRQPGLGPVADQVAQGVLRQPFTVVEPGQPVAVDPDLLQVPVGGQDVLSAQPGQPGGGAAFVLLFPKAASALDAET